jgi:hypothetical protein
LALVARRPLAAEGTKLAGLYAGHARREPDRPTAERLRKTFADIPLTIGKGPPQIVRHRTALSPLPRRILGLWGFSSALYTRLCTISAAPPSKGANRKVTGYGLHKMRKIEFDPTAFAYNGARHVANYQDSHDIAW